MTKLTFSQKVNKCFLEKQERERIEKLKLKEPSIDKLLMLHDSFQDAIIQTPLSILVKRIEAIEKSLEDVEQYLNNGEPLKVVVGRDYEGQPIEKEYDKNIGILIDKTNGIAERVRDMMKELKSSTEDALDIIHSKRSLLGSESVSDEEVSLQGLSWTDHIANSKKKGRS